MPPAPMSDCAPRAQVSGFTPPCFSSPACLFVRFIAVRYAKAALTVSVAFPTVSMVHLPRTPMGVQTATLRFSGRSVSPACARFLCRPSHWRGCVLGTNTWGGRRVSTISVTEPGRDPHSGRFLSNQARAQHSSFVHRHAFVGDLQRHFSLPPPIPEFETIETPGIVTDGKPIRSLRKRLHSFAGRWSGFDPLWAAIYPIYCRARHSKLQTIHCEGLPRMVGPAAAMPMRSGGLYIGGKAAPARTAALIGWRMTWEGRLSRETLTRAGRRLPPFGLFEWLAFAPDRGNDLRQTEWRIAMLRRFIVDLERTWAGWCSIVATMETVGHYLISPRLLPTRAVWIASLPRTASVLLPQEQPTAVSNLLRDFP